MRADARRNRERVLEAARAAFAEAGMAVPLDEIAARAGVGPGTVYRHFPTKEALFEAVMIARVQDLVEDARARVTAADPGPAFYGFLARLAEEAAAKRDLPDALGGSGGVGVADSVAAMRNALGTLLVRAQRAGAARPELRIDDLIALLKGLVVTIAGSDDPGLRARVLAVVLDGLRCTDPA